MSSTARRRRATTPVHGNDVGGSELGSVASSRSSLVGTSAAGTVQSEGLHGLDDCFELMLDGLNPHGSGNDVPTDVLRGILPNNGTSTISTSYTITMLLVDVALYAALYYRPYFTADPSLHYHRVVSHYIMVLTVTDLLAFFLPWNRRHW